MITLDMQQRYSSGMPCGLSGRGGLPEAACVLWGTGAARDPRRRDDGFGDVPRGAEMHGFAPRRAVEAASAAGTGAGAGSALALSAIA